MQEITIQSDDDGIRLDRWFSRHYPMLPFSELQRLTRKKLVRLDGKKIEARTRIMAGQVLRYPEFDEATLAAPKPAHPPKKPDWLDDAILYRDRNIIILNKPSGLPTQGGTGQTTHIDRLMPLMQYDAPKQPKLVHRLDKNTSGLLVLARSSKAAEIMGDAFANRLIDKRYLALCSGVPIKMEGDIKLPLAKRVYGGEEKMAVKQDGKPAHTHYRVIEHLAREYAWIECSPKTGRKHQLRVHLAAIECPILGDGKYGGNQAYSDDEKLSKRMHLHAYSIVIPASCFGKEITCTAPLPSHILKSCKHLEIKTSHL